MTVEELLKPRYKVISKYPGSEDWEEIDAIIELPDSRYKYCDDILCGEDYFDSYPNIYERMQWWDDRQVLPEYVKHNFTGAIVGTGNQSKITPSDILTSDGWWTLYDCQPATETEYLKHLKTKA